ncbi:SH3 domain-containing protein [Thermospira aquatica]|uniref:SH3 domain-containing protein n=1 Tax=Thermospira aquatica TaxID=2828656 RepID=A0AAX3BBF5_9SPIR|nr:SH3 domain-containing protein [Thermospira aquatica]URA09423.1 SH3 domain-containing protein [Thermospira aquatica]
MRKIIFTISIVCFLGTHIFLFADDIKPFNKLGEVFVINDNVPLFEKPDINSKEVLRIPILRRIRILSNTQFIFLSNNVRKEWIYIDTYIPISENMVKVNNRWQYLTHKGWVERRHLVGKGDFKKVSKMNEMFILIAYSEDGISYRIYKDGTFSYKYGDEPSYYGGSVYLCKANTNFFSFNHMEFFWYSNNIVEIPSPFVSRVEVLTNKSDFPKWAQSDKPFVFETYYILTGDNVNVRSEASTNSAVLFKLKKGARVKLLERSDVTFTIGDRTGNWVYIDTGVKDKKGNTIKGWVLDLYLSPEIYYILTGDNVNVLAEPSTNSAVLCKLKKGARVKLLERSDVTFTIGDRTGNWVYIDTGVKDKKGNTIKGWVVDIYLKEE